MRISGVLFNHSFVWLVLGLLFSFPLQAQKESRREIRRAAKVIRQIEDMPDFFRGWHHVGHLGIDTLELDEKEQRMALFLSPAVANMPIRYGWIEGLRHTLKQHLSRRYQNYNIDLFVLGRPLETFVPPWFRRGLMPDDSLRMAATPHAAPLVRQADASRFTKGLQGHHIALWPSHGYYYEAKLDRWEWQRARLFSTVEDIYPYSFVHTFLLPMLQNSGAHVLMPRERDIQKHEVVVDNDGSTGESEIWTEGALQIDTLNGGFALADTLFVGDNPFLQGTFLKMHAQNDTSAELIYLPHIPESGEYAVYASWAHVPDGRDTVEYVVNHSGGATRFFVNQTMGFGTWIYLGIFHFVEGKDVNKGSVMVSIPGDSKGWVTADAVKFGGGMGNLARKPAGQYISRKKSLNEDTEQVAESTHTETGNYSYKLSGKPRWMEAARYWLQYAGMPDTLVYSLNDNKNDYNDDYQSRGEWVNYLMGAPNGPTKAPGMPGLNIPIDMAFAFHTDAGVTPGDSVIGTLGIYSTVRNDGLFPNGKSKLASRDLTDLIQSQIVTDIRLTFNDRWTRRAMWDKEYSEAWRPNVPVMLLELLSHQNLADMEYGLDPRFKFTVARSIYKGMVRFQAAREGREAVIQPLAPDYMAIEHLNGRRVKVSWQPVSDPLEPTAIPTRYRVYQRVEDGGFDNGTLTAEPFLIVDLPDFKTLYSFRVVAENEGGQSMPGETLSVALQEDSRNLVLVVNGFDRIAPPAFVDGAVAGIAPWNDEGVPYIREAGFTGNQYDYDRSSPWLDDDSPGHGASHADREGQVIPGNTFDFVRVHGEALRDAGYAFVSVSDEAFEQPGFDAAGYSAVDIIFGEERGTPGLYFDGGKDFRMLTPEMRTALGRYLESGGNLFMSGAYVGTDMVENNDTTAIQFAEEYLHFAWRTNHADNVGEVLVTDAAAQVFPHSLEYNTSYHPNIYKVEAPDGIEPVGEGAKSICRYAVNNVSAGTAYAGNHRAIVLGFPFETIVDKEKRTELMKQVMRYFETTRE